MILYQTIIFPGPVNGELFTRYYGSQVDIPRHIFMSRFLPDTLSQHAFMTSYLVVILSLNIMATIKRPILSQHESQRFRHKIQFSDIVFVR